MILYLNKILGFAYGDSSAINSDNPHLTPCHVTGIFFQPGYCFNVGEKLWLFNRTCSYFFLSVDISHCLYLALVETYGHII